MRGWISVDTRLPDVEWVYEAVEVSSTIRFKTEFDFEFIGTMQTLYDDGHEYLMWCAKFKDKVEDVHEYLGYKIGKVTHWEPLPEPPEDQN